MKKIIFLFTVFLLSGCCKDEIIATYTFTPFEKNLIPYSGIENYQFVNENSESITAVSTPIEIITNTERPGPESCDLSQYQELKNRLRFESLKFDIAIEISSLYETQMHLFHKRYGEYNIGRFYLEREYGTFGPIEESLENISIAGFEFENVLIFKDYDEISEFSRIIFSPQNGIEFIEYDNGRYLKYLE